MASENEPVETVVQAHVEPSTDDETVEAPAGDAPEGAESEVEGELEGGGPQPKEKLVRRPTPDEITPENPKAPAEGLPANDLAEVDGETPRERALRLEVTRLRTENRKERGAEFLGQNQNPPPVHKEIDPKKAEILKKYKPEEIQSLREVLPVLAEEMGYVRSDQLDANSYTEKASGELDTFLEKHQEYLPENDKGNVLWGRFQEEYKMYKQPTDPRDFRRIFDRIHKDIFGIKTTGEGKGAIQAAQRKVQSAAHAGASAPTRSVAPTRPKTNTSGLRLDMLKGFTDEEKADMTGE